MSVKKDFEKELMENFKCKGYIGDERKPVLSEKEYIEELKRLNMYPLTKEEFDEIYEEMKLMEEYSTKNN